MFSLGLLWKALRGAPGVGGTALKKKMLGSWPWSQSPGCGLGETLAVPLSWRWSFALGAGTKLQRHWSPHHTGDTAHHTADTAPVAQWVLNWSFFRATSPCTVGLWSPGESAQAFIVLFWGPVQLVCAVLRWPPLPDL